MKVRIDKWLWAARFYKTRSLATAACQAGHIKVEGQTVKPSRQVHEGEQLEIRKQTILKIVEVVGLSDKRGPASVAQTLYIDHSPPPPPKTEVHTWEHRDRGLGRPTKRERRELQRLKGKV